MARSLLAGLALLGLALTAQAALAVDAMTTYGGPEYSGGVGTGRVGGRGGWRQAWHRTQLDFYRNNSWPEPFLAADKMAVRASYSIMTDNGWKMQNTIGTFLFDSETQKVNQAGELLVKWIVTQAPVSRRAVFVMKGDTAEATASRVQSVQATIAKFGAVCPVLITECEPAGWSAAYIDTITQQFNATIPAPRLPAAKTGGTGGGGGGGGGSGR